jgi:hypothetical protein
MGLNSSAMKTTSLHQIGGGMIVFAVTACAQLTEVPANSPYAAISRRNIFDLRPPVVEVPQPIKPPEPPANIVLVAAKDWEGVKSAILTVQQPPRPNQPPSTKTYTIKEGETLGGIQLVKIADVKTGEMEIVNNGTPMSINFKSHANKLQSGPPMMPGIPNIPGIVQQPGQPIGMPAPLPLPNLQNGIVVPNPGRVLPPPAPRSTVVSPSRTIRSIPGQVGNSLGVYNGTPAQPQPTPAPTEQTLSREAQAIMIEIERARTQPMVDKGQLPPLPPTEITPPTANLGN